MFKINFVKLVQWLIPAWLRSNTIAILVLAANKPLRDAYNSFITYRDAVNYKLAHNGQVCYLRKVLNDAFDKIDRRILIIDFSVFGKEYLYNVENTGKIKYSDGTANYFVYGADTGLDFTVQIPTSLVNTPAKTAAVKAKINEYKMDGKNFFLQKI